MTFSPRQISMRDRFGLLAVPPIVLLFVLVAFFAPHGGEGSDWAQFIGRFHLLTIHFPIALILLVPLFELAGNSRFFPGLRTSVNFLLALVTFSAIVAALLGWCLARSGAYSGWLVDQHMYGGVFVVGLCWLCWMLHGRFPAQRLSLVYTFTLFVAVVAVSFTGYRGGQISQGENHLTEHMPAPLRGWLGFPDQDKGPSAATSNSFFTLRVEPVFAQHCVSCHGKSKQKSGLRLNTYEAAMRGGKHGPVVKAGKPQVSELFRRVGLSPGDDKVMPPDGKQLLSSGEVKLLELWIAAGASPTLAADAIKDAPTNPTPVAEVTFDEIDVAAVAKQRAPLAATVAELQARFPDVLQYESRSSANIVVNTSLLGARFGDEDLAQLKPLYGQIVVADFSGTAITDRSAVAIAAMKQVRVLRLMHTKITDATIGNLAQAGLDQLQSLNVFGTAVSPAVLQVLARLPTLRNLYVGETKIPPNLPVPEAIKGKLSF